MTPYYYILTSSPYKIESTEILDDLIFLLFTGKAEFISEGQRIELKFPKNYFENLKKIISKYEERIPLYDITVNHIFLIHHENVYPRIYTDNYRFVDKNFLEDLKNLKNPNDADLENIRILSHYDVDVLDKTYMKIFYKSFVLNSYITTCRRPSFYSGMEHISPYYNINELYFLAYDWNLTTKATLSEKEIYNFCKKISSYDIPAQTLLDQQMYIYDSRAIGLIKHYSLFGSYYMNVYLRKSRYFSSSDSSKTFTDNIIRNLYLENQIKIMIRFVLNAPQFASSHTVYRFVEKDDYLKHLKIGDIYTDPSFMSTTRNPFYYTGNYAFGNILIKIKLPSNTKGVGLCIESYSNFPFEEEIILPPGSIYKLDEIIDTSKSENLMNRKIQKKYEFTWVGNNIGQNGPEIDMTDAHIPDLKINNLEDLLVDENIKNLAVMDRLPYFRQNYLNMNNQFSSKIGDVTYVFNFESYDSTSVYKPFFFYELHDGIMITTANPKYGNINIIMELGTEIHVNYYFRFSVSDPSMDVNLDKPEWISWLSMLACIIGSRTIVIHSNYVIYYNKDDTVQQKQDKTRYIYSQNIYLYMKYKKKMFEYTEMVPKFDYFQLDYLFKIKTKDVVNPTDKNELYRIYQISGVEILGDFYLHIVENYPKFIRVMEDKLESVYDDPKKNPFKNIMYSLDAWRYLYNRGLVKRIPLDKEFAARKGMYKKMIGDKKIPKFKNRLRAYLAGAI